MIRDNLQQRFQAAILHVLVKFGGRAKAGDVALQIKHTTNLFSEIEKRSNNPESAFRRHLYEERSFLLRIGRIQSSERGIWELSSQAYEEVKNRWSEQGEGSGLTLPFRYNPVEDFNQLTNLIDDAERAVRYLMWREKGINTAFPYDPVRRLTASKKAEEWHIGLYLASTLNRRDVPKLYTDNNIDSMSKLLAADFVSRIHQAHDQSRFNTLAGRYFHSEWSAPKSLISAAMIEAYHIHQLKNAINETDSIHPGSDENHIALIVHGTWAARDNWWRPGGDFWKYVKHHWPHLYNGKTPFVWSGGHSHHDRVKAAQDLSSWIKKTKVSSVDIIAHSHGGNVCLTAARAGLKINRLILLGTPIRTEYMVDLDNIGLINNVFSSSDRIQTPSGSFPNTRFEGRTLGDCKQVANWHAHRNAHGKEPGHSDLHEKATWIASELDRLL